jgi:hypothetical protein
MAAYIVDRFLTAVRALAARCKLSIALRPSLSRENITRTKEITSESTKESNPQLLLLFCGRHEGGGGKELRFLDLSAQLLRVRSPLLFSFLPFPELPL